MKLLSTVQGQVGVPLTMPKGGTQSPMVALKCIWLILLFSFAYEMIMVMRILPWYHVINNDKGGNVG